MAHLVKLAVMILLATTVRAEEIETATTIRGVRQQDVSRYSQSTFQCFNGVGSISSTQINDEYCDCEDGSDEPGTSACVNSHFYCHNVGSTELNLPSSRVNDGVCDCCDGTDEDAEYSHISCTNTCSEVGRDGSINARRRQEREVIAKKSAAFFSRPSSIQPVRLAPLRVHQLAQREKNRNAKALADAQINPSHSIVAAPSDAGAQLPNFPYPAEYAYKDKSEGEPQSNLPYHISTHQPLLDAFSPLVLCFVFISLLLLALAFLCFFLSRRPDALSVWISNKLLKPLRLLQQSGSMRSEETQAAVTGKRTKLGVFARVANMFRTQADTKSTV